MASPSLSFVFSSDLHGSAEQFALLVRHARQTRVRWILLGGDLHPDGNAQRQVDFARDVLFPLLQPAVAEGIRVGAIFGNHEWLPAEAPWRERPDLVHLVHGVRIPLDDTLALAGCPVVPYTPWYTKDYERWDDGPEPERSIRRLARTIRTVDGVERVYTPADPPPQETVADYLRGLKAAGDPRQTVYLMHGPPWDCALDVMHGPRHIGSRAVRAFCEQEQPWLTLHGHIHETVDLSGRFREVWGAGQSASSGNHPETSHLTVLEGDLYDRDGIRRVRIE